MSLESDLALANRLADAAGAAIRPFFRADCAHEAKADASPVTDADRGAETAMRRLLEAEAPRDGIIGEEFGTERAGAARQWVLDPIDGTVSFMAGRPIFGTLIALLQDGWPLLGIIDQPIAGERWVGAAGRPTLFNGKVAATRTCRSLADATLATTGPQYFADHDGEHFMALAARTAHKRMVFGGDCYNYGLLASGHVDLVVEAGLKLHDFAALVPVVEGAGGTMCDWNGEPLHAESDGHVIALGDPARLEDVIEGLACNH
ncbi:histidinol-phosphatase [Sphingopyxis sp. 113P3]|jgi:histidinol-phosphate phosphatase HisN, inositol monophosphatase family|uniref:histidinol-phosphatase n=1 Tax=Sphingopyxis sp. (strain 113P3) TaxID=292913 RepID=UPI0006AD148B|nr:histidinol-phosphatase [Sphingopyxis sp. 113P3]ALC14539.1 histidinol phosphate phosphatase [Sphingopyxis sp. 113P3]